MSVARLEMTESVKCGPQCPCGMHPMVIFEIKAGKSLRNHAHDAFDCLFEFVVTCTRIAVCCLIEAGVGQHGLAPRSANSPNGFVARHTNCGLAERRGKLFAASQTEKPQQILVTLDMAIERGLAHTQFFGDTGERKCVEALGIGERCGCVDYLLLIQWDSCHGRFSVRGSQTLSPLR